jgi:N-acetyl-anhydromuramyl-L-alanine amidase AmpD
VVGHGDIAPTRKTDPWNFDWKKLKWCYEIRFQIGATKGIVETLSS